VGVLHNDIKIDNILISETGKDLVLIDFGLSKGFRKKNGGLLPQYSEESFSGNVAFVSRHGMKY